jgi:hypothetical protein
VGRGGRDWQTHLRPMQQPHAAAPACRSHSCSCNPLPFLRLPADARGLLDRARLVVGAPMLSSASNVAFWLALCGAGPAHPAGRALVQVGGCWGRAGGS